MKKVLPIQVVFVGFESSNGGFNKDYSNRQWQRAYKLWGKDRECLFDIILRKLGIQHKITRSFLLWQNGNVERSHRIDGERFYFRKFDSFDSFIKAHKHYANRYNNIVQKVLHFKSLN